MVVGVEDAVAIEEEVQFRRDSDAAFGLGGAEAAFEDVGIGGVHLEPEDTFAPVAPAFVGADPAEIIDTHSFDAVAADAERVLGAFSAVVRVGEGVFENAEGREEVLEAAGEASGNWGSTDEVKLPVGGVPVEEEELGLAVAIDEDDELAGVEFGKGREVAGVELLHGGRDGDAAVDFGGEPGGVVAAVFRGCDVGESGEEEKSRYEGHERFRWTLPRGYLQWAGD